MCEAECGLHIKHMKGCAKKGGVNVLAYKVGRPGRAASVVDKGENRQLKGR